MAKVFMIGDLYKDITGPIRDDFVTDLVQLRDTTGEDITLDFTGVDSLSSIALAAVGKLHAWLQDHNRHLKVTGLSPNLHRLFTITGLTEILDVDPPAAGEAGPL